MGNKTHNTHYLKEILYDVEWQVLRVSLLSCNNDYGGFGTPNGLSVNLSKLCLYATADGVDRQEMARRFYRVNNLLAAVLSGYSGCGIATTEMLEMIKDFQSKISNMWHIDKEGLDMSQPWDWDKVKNDLKELYRKDDITFGKLWNDVSKRWDMAEYRKKKGKIKNIDRPELHRFLDLMQEIQHGDY